MREVNGLERHLGLRDREVVLTFDDGPVPGKTSAILKALQEECTKATFFSVGRMARAYPRLARKIVAKGHTLAHHTHRHSRLTAFSLESAGDRIDRGIAQVEKAAYGARQATPRVPFFRYPYLASNRSLGRMVAAKGLIAFGANIDSRDWALKSGDAILKRIMKRLKKDRKGIILMHDIHSRTAGMLPRLLRALHEGGYRVVHVVPPASRAVPQEPPLVASRNEDPILTASLQRLPARRTKPVRQIAIRLPGSQSEQAERQVRAISRARTAGTRDRQPMRLAGRTMFTSGGWRLRRSQWIIQ